MKYSPSANVRVIMVKNKDLDVKKVKVIKKVDLIETIRQIPHGETVQFARQELGPEGSVRSAVWRLNDRLKKLTGRQEPEYSLELIDIGLFYNITRT